MDKKIFRVTASRSFTPYEITCDSKLGKCYPRAIGIDSGKKDLGVIIIIGMYILNSTPLYGTQSEKAKPRDWFLLVFIDSEGRLCTTCFHSASYGALSRLLEGIDYMGKDINEVKIKMGYEKDPIKCDKGAYYKLYFEVSDNPITDAEKEAIEQYKEAYPFAHLPARHIVQAFKENPNDGQRICDMLNLSKEELGYITEYATRIDTTTGLVETPAAILQLNAKN